jgi:hypothetical protein
VLRVRREDPQLGADLASLIDDLQGAAPEHRRVVLSEGVPRPDHLVGQESEVDHSERDEKSLVLHGAASVCGEDTAIVEIHGFSLTDRGGS